jgi:hypothetical protein
VPKVGALHLEHGRVFFGGGFCLGREAPGPCRQLPGGLRTRFPFMPGRPASGKCWTAHNESAPRRVKGRFHRPMDPASHPLWDGPYVRARLDGGGAVLVDGVVVEAGLVQRRQGGADEPELGPSSTRLLNHDVGVAGFAHRPHHQRRGGSAGSGSGVGTGGGVRSVCCHDAAARSITGATQSVIALSSVTL